VVSGTANTLQIYDVSDPTAIAVKDTDNTGLSAPRAVDVSGNYAYVVDADSLSIFDISDPTSIVFKDADTTNLSSCTDVCVSGNYAYVSSSGNNRLCIFDISDPTSIVAKGYIETSLYVPRNVFAYGNYAWVFSSCAFAAQNKNNLSVFDVTDKDTPVFIASAKGNPFSTNPVYYPAYSDIDFSQNLCAVVGRGSDATVGLSINILDISNFDDIILKSTITTNLNEPSCIHGVSDPFPPPPVTVTIPKQVIII
jgi:hypothetical protein